MAEIGSLFVRIGADASQLKRAFADVKTATHNLQASLQGAGALLTQRVTLPLIGLGTAAVAAAGSLQQARLGLETVAGSAEAANEQMERLRAIARSPGLGFRQVVEASVQLQTLGFTAEGAEAAIRELGNAVALTGGTAADFAEVTRQFSQIRSLGRLTAENLNVIIERSPAVAAAMQAAFGSASAEAIRESGIGIEEFFDRLQVGLQTLPRAQQGIVDAFANLKDDITVALAPLGEAIAAQLIPALERVVDFVTRVSEAFRGLNPETQKWIVYLGAAATALGPLLIVLGGLVGALGFLVTPMGLVVVAITGLVAAFVLVYTQSEKLRAAVAGLLPAFRDNARAVLQLTGALADVGRQLGFARGETERMSEGMRRMLSLIPTAPFRLFADVLRLVTGYVRGLAAALEVLATGRFAEGGFLGFLAQVTERFRQLGRAADDAAGAINKLRVLTVGKKADEAVAPGNPYAGVSSGATGAAEDVRTLLDVIRDANAELARLPVLVSLGLIDPLEEARRRADTLRAAIEEALTIEGTTAADVDDLARQFTQANEDVQRLVANAEQLTEEMRRAGAEAEQMAAKIARAVKAASDAVNQVDKPLVQGGDKGPLTFLQEMQGLARELADLLVNDLARAFGELGSAFFDFRDNFKDLSDIAEAFKAFGRTMGRILADLVADLVAAIAKMLLLRAIASLFGGGGLVSTLAGIVGAQAAPAFPVAGALAGGGTVRLEFGGTARAVPGGMFIPVSGGWVRHLREETRVERGAGLSGAL